jgi:hypothetical protein
VVVDVVEQAKRVRSKLLKWFFRDYLFKIDHCREDNTLVHYHCDEIPHYIDIECLHYEGFSTDDLARLLAGLVMLEKVLRAEASIRLMDRASERLVIRVYKPAWLCRSKRSAPSKALEVLRKYALTDNFEEAVKELSSFVDTSKLAQLLLKLEEWGYELEGFTLLKDPESSEPHTVAIHVKGCGLDEWEMVVKSIKRRLLEEGFSDLAGKVTIVCIDLFKFKPGGEG